MARNSRSDNTDRDIDICRFKLLAILKEYNCDIQDREQFHGCIIVDNDTKETKSFP